MREASTKPIGSQMERRTVLGGLCAGMGVLMLAMQSACGYEGSRVTDPDDPPPAASVAGTWSGGNDAIHLVWRLTQDGERVHGTGQVRGGDEWNGAGGQVVGKVDGSAFGFNETHGIGTLTVSDCSAELEGTLQVSTPPEVPPPGRWYYSPGVSLQPSPPPAFTSSMSGYVRGQVCGRPFSGAVTMLRNSVGHDRE